METLNEQMKTCAMDTLRYIAFVEPKRQTRVACVKAIHAVLALEYGHPYRDAMVNKLYGHGFKFETPYFA